MKLVINTDGGGQSSADVGGAAAAGYVCQTSEGIYLGSRSVCLLGTNNDAEYLGVLLAVNDIRDGVMAPLKDIDSVKFIGDSQLIVYHITGTWKCKNDKLRVHRDEIRKVVKSLPFPVDFTWERREYNTNADRLCAAAMEHGPKTNFHLPIPPDPRKKKGISHDHKTIRNRVKDFVVAVGDFEPSDPWV